MFNRYLVNFSISEIALQHSCDLVIVGSGVAGLFTALKAAKHSRVILLTKSWSESNTRYAQGGIAAVLDEKSDSFEKHFQDTVKAGAGLCDEEAVRILVAEGPQRVRDLIELGTHFDTDSCGSFALTREGGHSNCRILRSYGDQTGREIAESLQQRVLEHPNITVLKQCFAIDLLTDGNEVLGVLALNADDELVAVWAHCTVLATGGIGQVYSNTTNPEVATGDGIAMAYRAGAEVMNLEFVQFHPTALALEDQPTFLISEAVRGEGAVLRNASGERFMPLYHPLAELAPRDIVAKAIVSEMNKTKCNKVYLDLSQLKGVRVEERFPLIYRTLLSYGLDCTREWVPVAPAAHYSSGGIRVDHNGRTSLARLYACGEGACCGLHGANRLASNSLLDALVFGHRVAEAVRADYAQRPLVRSELRYSCQRWEDKCPQAEQIRHRIQSIMWEKAGLVRSAASLKKAAEELAQLLPFAWRTLFTVAEFEVVNLLTVAMLIVRSAYARRESRGGHYRSDFPDSRESFRRYTIVRR